jgi:hypothetical protein
MAICPGYGQCTAALTVGVRQGSRKERLQGHKLWIWPPLFVFYPDLDMLLSHLPPPGLKTQETLMTCRVTGFQVGIQSNHNCLEETDLLLTEIEMRMLERKEKVGAFCFKVCITCCNLPKQCRGQGLWTWKLMHGLAFCHHHKPAVWHCRDYLASLHMSFTISKHGTITEPTLYGSWSVNLS